MADPFSALGLAGNIITFVDLTWKLLSGAHAIYRSQSGTSAENAVLGIIARDIGSLSDRVIVEQAHSEDLRALATESKHVATEVLDALKKVKVKGPNTRWTSLKAALKEVWNRGEIEDLERRLSKLQMQVTSHVQHIMGNKLSEISLAVNGLVQTNSLLSVDIRKLASMDGMVKDILEAIKAMQSGDSDTMESLSQAVSSLSVHGQELAHDQALLGSLHFPMIQARHEKIAQAHAETYEWIFRGPRDYDSPPIGFDEWLEQGSGIFWIQGKAGCGKSTLMKFIYQHRETQKHLLNWAESHFTSLEDLRRAARDRGQPCTDDETKLNFESGLVKSYLGTQGGSEADGDPLVAKLVMAKYFFWNSGSALQKSEEGLLRSLLFEVLRQCPELIGHVRRRRSQYRSYSGPLEERGHLAMAEAWSVEELLSAFQDVTSTRASAAFCLFIDGLDEYVEEHKHSHRDLADTLHRIAQSPNVKICASSRPWTVFRDAFEKRAANSLKLEDLTRDDIHRFASDSFEAHEQYQRLCKYNADYAELVDEVAARSQGVFLWVFLVVRSLLEGLTHHDSVKTMRQRLDEFPPDLERFFEHMIESIPAVYRRQAARTFLITLVTPQPLLVMVHSFLDDVEADPEFCTKFPQVPIDDAEFDFRHERLRRQLDGQTKGLLEIVYDPDTEALKPRPYFSFSVDFLHRTVKDFLESSSKAQSFMTNGHEDVSETWVMVCRGILAAARYAPYSPKDRYPVGYGMSMYCSHVDFMMIQRLLSDFADFSGHALEDPNNEAVILSLFKAIEDSERKVNLDIDQAGRDAVDATKSRLPKLLSEHGHLTLMQWMDYDWSEPNASFLLNNTLTSWRGVAAESQLTTVKYLLDHGADPNRKVHSWVPFQSYLTNLYRERWQRRTDTVAFRIVAALVAHGGDLSVSIDPKPGGADQGLTAEAAIRGIFPPELARRILAGAPGGGITYITTANPPPYTKRAESDQFNAGNDKAPDNIKLPYRITAAPLERDQPWLEFTMLKRMGKDY